MSNKMPEETVYREARRRVRAKRRFYRSLTFYVVVNLICVVVWALSDRSYPWFLWVLGPWGVFLLLHFLRAFVFEQRSERGAVEREVEKIRRDEG